MRTDRSDQIRELNRDQLLDNLMHMIGWRGMTYAEVESAAGVYNGYISRMKSDPRKLPALDVVWKMAQVLGVSLEWLLEGTVGDLDENILYMRRFLQRLFDLTVKRQMIWQSFSYGQLQKMISGEQSPQDLPCLSVGPDGGLRPYSGAYPEMDNRFADAAYVTKIDDGHALCLARLQFSEQMDPDDSASMLDNEWLELQMQDLATGERSMVACSCFGHDEHLAGDMEKLYQQLQEHVTDLRLDPAMRRTIDAFMNEWESR